MADLRRARDQLSSASDRPLIAVSFGTPHFSVAEFAALAALIRGRSFSPPLDVWINTSREVLDRVRSDGSLLACEAAGARVVTDTCNYVTPILRNADGTVMTCSAKWAWYAPANLGVDVAFGSMADCVESAVAGELVRDTELWRD
jgi:predicted aconitase